MKKNLRFTSLTLLVLLLLVFTYNFCSSTSFSESKLFYTKQRLGGFNKPKLKFVSSKHNSFFSMDFGPYAAHRGIASKLPENSLQAFKVSKDLGYKVVETDLRLTKDNTWILMHDYTLDRTTTGKGLVSKYKLDDLNKLSLKGDSKSEAYGIPTLEEFIKLCKEEDLIPILDIKINDTEIRQQDYKELISILNKYDMLSKSIISSNHKEVLGNVRNLSSESPLAVMMDINNSTIDLIKELGNSFVYFRYKDIDPDKIQLMKENNIKYAVWTVDNLEDAEYFTNQGALFIVTDALYPSNVIKQASK
ncbi:glycerophosphodiester phosphodiesterase [Clostridium polynesiense]|uniref:glycerophosphodiester phosphodiesterase n=1 Tax=Clostridium polynesiense TaxID=1325933 RepID=UPI000590582B|nr:glycerophosphodiester phosphodiesterase family protein [Clostridium polynesiense]